MTIAQDPQKFLETFNEQLDTVANEAATASQQFANKIAEAERLVTEFKATGTGDLATVHQAESELAALDRLLFDPRYRPTTAMAAQERQLWLANHAASQAGAAREKLVRDSVREVADALDALIGARAKTRAAWREDRVDSMLAVDKRVRLDESLDEHGARVLRVRANKIDAEIAAHDSIHFNAVRLVKKLRVSPSVETFHDALGFAVQVDYAL